MTISEITRHRPGSGGLRARRFDRYAGPRSAELARRIVSWADKGLRATDPEFAAVCGRMANRYARQLEAIQMGGVM